MNIEKERTPPMLQEQAIKLIAPLTRSETYLRGRKSGESHLHSLEIAALAISETRKPQEAALLDTILKTGPYIDARQELAHIEAAGDYRPLSDAEKRTIRELKEHHIIPFNHSVKEFINTHPNETIKNTAQTLTWSYFGLYAKHDTLRAGTKQPDDIPKASSVVFQLEESINGMRHEIAAETMMAARDIDYSYDVSVHEDKRGTDLYFYNGSNWVPINIKASDTGVENARTKHNAYNAVSTGLDWSDFKGMKGTTPGALTISFATADAKSDQFVEKLQRASEAYSQRGQSVGRKALQPTH